MKNFIYLSKDGTDEYINMLALGSQGRIIRSDDFNFEDSNDPIVLRGILKKKLIQKCWQTQRTFYFMDTGYFGNHPNPQNPLGWKLYHRIVKNDLQHGSQITHRNDDRFRKLQLPLHNWKKGGRKILIAKPDDKPMRFYGLDLDEWLDNTVSEIKKHTDRPIVIRDRVKSRLDRVVHNTLKEALDDDTHCLITFNSNAATEAVMYGYPAFTLSPTHAASPVTYQDLSKIETPYYPDKDLVYAWACHLAYGQFHISELKDGNVWKIIEN